MIKMSKFQWTEEDDKRIQETVRRRKEGLLRMNQKRLRLKALRREQQQESRKSSLPVKAAIVG
ncbi:MAG: hypothetical protein GY940_47395 [bacterium]|nr:hypothetical protein [bacterium]